MSWLRTMATVIAVSASSALLFRGVQALADGDLSTDAVPGLLAYDGELAKDGVGYSGTVTLVFRLYDGAGAATESWSEQQVVYASHGRFSVLLGAGSSTSSSALRALLANADDVYLTVALVHGDQEIAFGNQQRLLSPGAALWAPAMSETTLSKRVTVVSSLAVSTTDGPLVVASAGTSNTVRVGPSTVDIADGSIVATMVQVGGLVKTKRLDLKHSTYGQGAALNHVSGDKLVIADDVNAFAGGTKITGALNIVGALSGADATTTTTDGYQRYDLGLTSGTLFQACPDGKIMRGGNWQGLNNNGKFLQFMDCYSPKITVR